jgi:hypothetical protein
MKNLKVKKLKNRYTNEVVYTKNINETVVNGETTFIKVYREGMPHREFLVNKDSFEILAK